MDAVRKLAVIKEDGRVTVDGLPYKKGDKVEIIVLKGGVNAPRATTARELANSALVGMWADRIDISDSSEYARKLRNNAQERGDRK